MAQDFNEHGLNDDVELGNQAHEELNETRKRNVSNLVSNPKTRPKVLMTVVALVFMGLVGVVTLMGSKSKSHDDSEASLSKPNVRTDGKMTLNAESSKAYSELKTADNEIKSQEAIKTGGAHIEIPVAGVKKEDETPATQTQPQVQVVQNAYGNNPPPVQVAVRDPAYDKGMQTQFQAILESYAFKTPRTVQTQYLQNQQNQQNNTATQTAGAITVAANGAVNTVASAATAGANTNDFDLYIKAGQIALGTVDLEANSDEPGEILATIHSGKLKGSKAICGFTKGKEALTLRCTLVSPPWGTESYAANILLIDPDTNRKDMATEVDHHYLERYGFLLASSFVQGLGEAAARANSVVSTSPLGSTETQGKLDTSSTVLVAAGRAGAAASQELQKHSDIPTTVKVRAGQPVGFLFLTDFKAKSEAKALEASK